MPLYERKVCVEKIIETKCIRANEQRTCFSFFPHFQLTYDVNKVFYINVVILFKLWEIYGRLHPGRFLLPWLKKVLKISRISTHTESTLSGKPVFCGCMFLMVSVETQQDDLWLKMNSEIMSV